ncbi:MAG: alanine racemase [Clostridium sp.]|jgi:alanine racemase|nr:alanine racemase [Clostridium sp.]
MDVREQEYQRVYAQVDLDAVAWNFRAMKAGLPPETRVMAVVKADGYGHGSIPVARCLEKLDSCWGFGVAVPEEAFLLREAGIRKPLMVLGYAFPCRYARMAAEEIRFTAFRPDQAGELALAAAARRVKVHVKVDTGMGRIGIAPDETGLRFLRLLRETPGVEIEGIFTHFARADEPERALAEEPFARFLRFVQKAEKELGFTIPIKHCSNSAGILRMPQAGLDMARAGISLYGLYPSGDTRLYPAVLRPALSLHSRIVYCKQLREGQSVSYGGTFTATRDLRVATVPVGYGDGYPRSLSGKGQVLIDGKQAPILGRVCMDQFLVDVSRIPGAREGSPVTLLGKDGERSIPAQELAELSGRFFYELLCGFGKRIPRVYLQGGAVSGTKDYFSLDGQVNTFR